MRLAKAFLVLLCLILLHGCGGGDSTSPNRSTILPVAEAHRLACRANMQTIANAVLDARAKTKALDYSALIAGGVTTINLPDLKAVPVCPDGGTYTLFVGSSGVATTFNVRCSHPGHGTFEPGVDSQ